jgi:NAD(P)H-dependent FMN reductase
MLKLQVITVSTRDGRQGTQVADWFNAIARSHGKFEIEPVDLKKINLPLLDEPRHPRFRQYEHEHTKRWSAIVDRADAYVFVTPEYNFSCPPSLSNALDYLSQEWAYKPAGFVSYGGVSGGTRGVQMSKQIVSALRMVPVMEAVSIPFFTQYINDDTHVFAPGDVRDKAALTLLDEMLKWATALKPMRG